ncbi:MAG: hypothetical protein AB8B93_11505 [Pseudomonadales bacterium]
MANHRLMYHLTEAYLLATFISLLAAVWGAQLLAISAVPRLLRTTLDAAPLHKTMHSYWPTFFKWAMAWGVFATIIIGCSVPFSAIPNIYGLLLTAIAGLATLCNYSAWLARSRQLHADTDRAGHGTDLGTLPALLIIAGLAAGLWLIAALVYVLPGQFTFWPTANVS